MANIDLSTTVQNGNRTLTIHISERIEDGNESALLNLQSELDNVVSAFQKNAPQHGNQLSRERCFNRQPNSSSSSANSGSTKLKDGITFRQLDTLQRILKDDPRLQKEICEQNGVQRLEDLTKNAAWHIIKDFGKA